MSTCLPAELIIEQQVELPTGPSHVLGSATMLGARLAGAGHGQGPVHTRRSAPICSFALARGTWASMTFYSTSRSAVSCPSLLVSAPMSRETKRVHLSPCDPSFFIRATHPCPFPPRSLRAHPERSECGVLGSESRGEGMSRPLHSPLLGRGHSQPVTLGILRKASLLIENTR